MRICQANISIKSNTVLLLLLPILVVFALCCLVPLTAEASSDNNTKWLYIEKHVNPYSNKNCSLASTNMTMLLNHNKDLQHIWAIRDSFCQTDRWFLSLLLDSTPSPLSSTSSSISSYSIENTLSYMFVSSNTTTTDEDSVVGHIVLFNDSHDCLLSDNTSANSNYSYPSAISLPLYSSSAPLSANMSEGWRLDTCREMTSVSSTTGKESRSIVFIRLWKTPYYYDLLSIPMSYSIQLFER